jgi:FdhE protein
MSLDPWQQRIQRAEQLAGQYSFASQVLNFYIHIAEFQRDLHRILERSSTPAQRASLPGPSPELSNLLTSFPKFLQMVERHGSRPLAGYARILLTQTPEDHAELLDKFWTEQTSSDSLAEFTARAFLQPYAEFVRALSGLAFENYSQAPCPFCGREPGFGVLRPLGDGGKRFLVCSLCLAEWPFRRIVCAGCGEEDHSKLPVYTAEQLVHLRVECCDTCGRYLKTVDLTKDGLAVPLVDEMAAIPLDLWAQERGYSKLKANLMQI